MGSAAGASRQGLPAGQRPGGGTPLPARVARSVHVWSTRHRSRAVRNGLQRCPAVGRSPRSQARSWGNRLGGRTLISLGAALRRRPFPDENWGGCPLTPDVLGRRRPLISRVLGAAPGPFTFGSHTP